MGTFLEADERSSAAAENHHVKSTAARLSTTTQTFGHEPSDGVQIELKSAGKRIDSSSGSDDDGGTPAKAIDNNAVHTFEDVLSMIQNDGRWQLYIMLTCLFTSVALQVSNYAQGIFFVGKLDHSCTDFGDMSNMTGDINHNFPYKSPNNATSLIVSSNDDDVHTLACASAAGARCRAWNYSSPYYGRTMQNEWNLVCEQSYKIPLFQSSYLIGYGLGMPLFGALADLYGRRIVIMIAWPLLMASYIATAFSPSYWMVAAMRGLQGLLSGGDWKAKYVLTMEVTSIERRNFVSVMIGSCFPLAALIATALAWYIRDWRTLQLACVTPVLLILPLLFFIPESPRWLITHSRYDEARKTLARGARYNGRKLPPNLDLKRLHDMHGHDDETLTTALSRFKSMLATSELRKRSFVLFFQWFVVELVFNGAMFYGTGVMPGNPFLVLVAISIMRLLNNPVQIYLFNRIGVRNSHVILLMATAISCGALGALPASWMAGVNVLGIVLLVSGNCFSDACEGALDILTTEAYPTTLRQTGVGVCSMWAQVGAGISPFIAESLSVYWQPLPATIFSSVCFLAALVIVLWFPTVENAVLPDTINDTEVFAAENFGASLNDDEGQQHRGACEAADAVRHRHVVNRSRKASAVPA